MSLPCSIKTLLSVLRPGDTVVEIGANEGTVTLAVAERVGPLGKVWAFESNPDRFDRLSETIQNSEVQAEVKLISKTPTQREIGRGSRLDHITQSLLVDVMTIDGTVYHKQVLEGATMLFKDPHRRPRVVHFTTPAVLPINELSEWFGERGYAASIVDNDSLYFVCGGVESD